MLSATAIAQEKESDTWTLLLTTPLTGRAIVWGKVLGVYKRLAWPAALILTHFLAFTLFGVITWQALLVTALGDLHVQLDLGRERRLPVAAPPEGDGRRDRQPAAGGRDLPGGFFVLLIAGEMTGGHDLQELVAWYLPYFYLAEGITATWSGQRGFDLPAGDWRVSAETSSRSVFAVGVVHLAVSYGILRVTARSFDRIVGRAAGSGGRPGRCGRRRHGDGRHTDRRRILIPGIGPRLTIFRPRAEPFAGPAA